MSMPVQTVFARADRALERVVLQVRDDQWDQQLPSHFATMRESVEPPTLREVLGYHAYDEAWVPDMLAGRTVEEVGPTAYDGDLLGADPKAYFSRLVDQGVAAAEQVDNLEQPVHFSYGDWPTEEALWHLTSFRALRAVDLARFIGVDDSLEPDLVQALWDGFSARAEQWRQFGVFPDPVRVAEDAPLQQRLLGLTGRPPTA